jgi:hypothetical protein
MPSWRGAQLKHRLNFTLPYDDNSYNDINDDVHDNYFYYYNSTGDNG